MFVDGDWKYLENADGSRRELYKLDLYNASEAVRMQTLLNDALRFQQQIQ